MSGFRVVRADLHDAAHAAAFTACTASYARDPMGGGCELPAETLARNLAALAEWPTAVIFLALEDGTGAAVGVATCFRGWGTFQARPLINVHDLAVVPAHRRRGVGRALLQAVVDLARAEGCGKVTLEALPLNEPAHALYAALGFKFGAMQFGELKLAPGPSPGGGGSC
jgi:GNAT superfamily N-acetyltransferase